MTCRRYAAQVLVKLLDKFDPKSDGADRSYSDIYEESSKLLYEEIDYGLEAANCLRFAESLQQAGLDYVRVPQVYNEVTTPRVLTLEYVPSFKLTDLPRVEGESVTSAGGGGWGLVRVPGRAVIPARRTPGCATRARRRFARWCACPVVALGALAQWALPGSGASRP